MVVWSPEIFSQKLCNCFEIHFCYVNGNNCG